MKRHKWNATYICSYIRNKSTCVVGDKVSFIIGKNMAGKAVAKKVKIINDEIGVEEEKKEDSEIPQLEQRLLMELIFERDRIMRERQKVNSMIKSRK